MHPIKISIGIANQGYLYPVGYVFASGLSLGSSVLLLGL